MISVCMATYNGERYLRRQLETILPQLAADDELVISDDSSTDATLAIINSFADARIRLFPGQTFRSPVFNFEHALQQARGEIIVLADQDDVWLPHKIDLVRRFFAADARRPLLMVMDATVVDAEEREIYPSVLQKLNAGPGFWKNLYDNRYLGCCMAFSRDLLARALPFPRNMPMHDIWLGQLCERIGTTEFVPVVTMKYRKHSASMTEFKIQFKPLLQIRRRLILLWNLLERMLWVRGSGLRAGGTWLGARGSGLGVQDSSDQGSAARICPEPSSPVPEPSALSPEPSAPSPQPLFSIIMPSYNQVQFLEEAVRSVLDQQGVALELLVMDPGSTDGSRELLLKLKREYGASLRLCFEPDSGQSDAVNRGMTEAQGEILGWLNSDDRLRPGILAQAAELLKGGQPAWLYGRAGMIDGDGRAISGFIVRYKNWRGAAFSRAKLLTENFIPQMAVFWNRQMWAAAGGLDAARDLDMDYDLWLRFAAVADPVVVHRELADFRVHGEAKGSRRTGEQLAAAYATAKAHAAGLGLKGRMALLLHKLLSLRTRIVYLVLKP